MPERPDAIAGAASSLGGTLQMLMASLFMILGGLVFDGTSLPMLVLIGFCAVMTFVLALITVRNKPIVPGAGVVVK